MHSLRIAGALTLLLASSSAGADDLDALRQAARSNRRDAATQRAYGLALVDAARYAEAERVLRNAARLADDSLASLYDLARIPIAQGDYRRSRAACRALERKERDAPLTRVCRARAFLVWNRSGRAFEELEAAVEAAPNNFEAQLALGDAHRLRAQVREAESAYQRAISIDGERAEPHFGLGLLYAGARRDADALRALRTAHRLDPDDTAIGFELATRLEPSDSRPLLERVLARRPDFTDALVALADLELRGGDPQAAIERYGAVIAEDERNAAAHAGLGQALFGAERPAEAADALRRSLELVPNQPNVVLTLGRIREAAGEHQEAFTQYRHAADLAPQNPSGLLAAAKLALTLRRDVLATGYLDRVLQRHAQSAQALAYYGDAMRLRRDRSSAREYYQRALRGQGPVDRARIQRALRELQEDERRPPPMQRATVR